MTREGGTVRLSTGDSRSVMWGALWLSALPSLGIESDATLLTNC